jgi:hypothetical protein
VVNISRNIQLNVNTGKNDLFFVLTQEWAGARAGISEEFKDGGSNII